LRKRLLIAGACAVCGGLSFAQPPTTLYAGSAADVYKSIDNGATWNATHIFGYNSVLFAAVLPSSGSVVSVVVDPIQSSNVYAATTASLDSSATSITGIVSPKGIYRSTDSGMTWSPAINGLPTSATDPVVITALSIDPRNPRTLYAALKAHGIFKTTDGATTWQPTGFTGNIATTIAIDPSNAGTVYATIGVAIFKTTDGGETWNNVSSLPGEVDGFDLITSMVIDASHSNTLYASCNYQSSAPRCGVFKSTDGGVSWQSILQGQFNSVTVDPSSPAIIYAAGINDAGGFTDPSGYALKSSDAGGTWAPVNQGLTSTDALVVAVDPSNSAAVYLGAFAGAADGILYKSTDGGANWQQSDSGIDRPGILPSFSYNVSTIALSPANPSPPPQTKPIISAVVNAATLQAGPIAPGEQVTIFGSGLGPAQLVSATVGPTGLPLMVGRTRVIFIACAAGSPCKPFNAPVLYVSSTQIGVFVPYGISGSASAQVSVLNFDLDNPSDALSVPVADVAPGIFTLNASGTGQATMRNEDTSVNGPDNPAALGSSVVIFATGEGQTTPPGVDGKIATDTLPQPLQPVAVTIGGFPASIQYAGAAPQQPAGVLQVNATVPIAVAPGSAVPVVLSVGSVPSQSGVTMGVGPVVPPPPKTYSVFLIHGIAQTSADMAGLAATLEGPQYGLDASRFQIDAGFDYSNCANTVSCKADCSISDGANKLAAYMAAAAPQNDIVLIGYSMGGLIARDMALNHPELFTNRRLAALITLGTPNLGYPYDPIDDTLRCGPLARQMFGDFRNLAEPAEGQKNLTDDLNYNIAVSNYLWDLNTRWVGGPFPGQPQIWLTAAGTFCDNETRNYPLTGVRGCTTGTFNDGVVCEQSASFSFATRGSRPTDRWSDPNYAHTNDLGTFAVFCSSAPSGLTTLYNPPDYGSLVQKIRNSLNGLP
jgi:uncharacterized protein (TIGR03437 family)